MYVLSSCPWCVCVCVRERERESGGRGGERERERVRRRPSDTGRGGREGGRLALLSHTLQQTDTQTHRHITGEARVERQARLFDELSR
jgi:hypothetical protein